MAGSTVDNCTRTSVRNVSKAGALCNKAILRRIHKWLGLSLALYLVLQTTTGILLVYRHELQASWSHFGSPNIDTGVSVSMQSVLERIGAVYPQLEVDRIYYPKVRGEPYIAHLRGAEGGAVRLAEIDPSSGKVRDASPVVRLLEFAFDLHHELLLGSAGLYLVGILGLALLTSAVSGLWLWWPGLRRLRRAYKVKLRGAGVRSLFDWHRVTGSLVAPIVVVSAITGFLLSYGGLLRTAFAVPAVPVRAATQSPAGPPIDVDTLIAIAASTIPHGGVRDVRFDPDNGLLAAVVFFDESRHQSGPLDRVWVDPHNGEVLGISESEKLDTGNRFFAWLYPLHTELGLADKGKALSTAGGVGLLLLSVTGPWLWWRKRQRRSRS